MLTWSRYVALGDSFTEGLGDPDSRVPGGNRGWADRAAETLALTANGFHYANLAVRGRVIRQILDEQVEPAMALAPDLVSFSAGGNDVIRPGTDPDDIAALYELAAKRLAQSGATVVLFTGVDVGFSPVFRRLRGKVAIYNENIRAIAASTGALVADMWALDEVQDPRLWTEDRLHMNSLGHRTVARMFLDTLETPHDILAPLPRPLEQKSWRQARGEDAVWAKEYFGPWVKRRLRGQSSGDTVSAKRPELSTVEIHLDDELPQ